MNRIVTDRAVLAGKPVVRGTRLAVKFILTLIAEGWSHRDILASYPQLVEADIEACLRHLISHEPLLLGDDYQAPECKVGKVLGCLRFGDRPVDGLTDARIQWPYSVGTGGKQLLHLIGDLVRAVRYESSQAVAFHWGVERTTVRRWRRVLGIEQSTPGTMLLFRALWAGKLTPDALSLGGRNARANQRRLKDLHTPRMEAP